MVHEVQMGTRKRMSFSRINEVLDMPDLIEVQKNSYKRFVEEDLREVLDDISPITDYTEKLVLEFVDYSIDFDHPKYSVEECKERDVNYCAPLKVLVRLINKETGEVKARRLWPMRRPGMSVPVYAGLHTPHFREQRGSLWENADISHRLPC